MTDHPQLLSTSRHITQGVLDVVEESWDAASHSLTGKSQVVAGDPYELRIALPQPNRWQVTELQADGDATFTLGEVQGDLQGRGLRATLVSPSSRTIAWKIVFQP